jgi:hypothetical protein
MPQCVSNQICDIPPPEPAIATARIQMGIHSLRVPIEELYLLVSGKRTIFGLGLVKNAFSFPLQPRQNLFRQGIRQTKCNKVARTFTLEVWQRSA